MRAWPMRVTLAALVLLLARPLCAQQAVELHLGTLEVGYSSERQTVQRLGRGLVLAGPDGGHIHIYADPDRATSLYVSCGSDGVVEEVQLVSGLSRPLTRSMLTSAPLRSWRTGSGVGLGLAQERLIMYYGDPTRETNIGGLHWLTYATDYGHDKRVRLYYQASFGFDHERLVRILLHNS
jgi:hypothetical protein